KAIIDYGSGNTYENNVNVSSTKYYGTVYLSGKSAKVKNNAFRDTLPKVIKATVTTVYKVSGTVGETVKLAASVKTVDGQKVTGGTVIFKINGKTFKTTDTFSGSASSKKISVKKGVASYSFIAPIEFGKIKNVSATYSGSADYLASSSKVIKSSVSYRSASMILRLSTTNAKQYQTIKLTAKINDTKTGKAIANNDNNYVIFKIDGVAIKNSKNKVIKTKVVDGVATYNYVVPGGMAGFYDNGSARYYKVSAEFIGPAYKTPKEPTKQFTVKKSSITVQTTKAAIDTATNKLRLEAKIKDTKGKVISGESSIIIKVNGKTIKYKGKATPTVKNGKIAMTLNLGTITDIDSVSIYISPSNAYFSYKGDIKTTRV
ncbi:MAG: hypothetical protein BZ135_09035, partial [Methanosphaera sp. rholeuAM6]